MDSKPRTCRISGVGVDLVVSARSSYSSYRRSRSGKILSLRRRVALVVSTVVVVVVHGASGIGLHGASRRNGELGSRRASTVAEARWGLFDCVFSPLHDSLLFERPTVPGTIPRHLARQVGG